MGDNAALTAAKRAKKDEFYTQRVDIDLRVIVSGRFIKYTKEIRTAI